MIVGTAVLIISDEQYRIFPVRTATYRTYDLGDEVFASANIVRRMLIGREIGFSCEQGIDQRDLRQVAGSGVGEETRDWLEVDRLLGAELARLRNIAEVID